MGAVFQIWLAMGANDEFRLGDPIRFPQNPSQKRMGRLRLGRVGFQ